MGSDSIDYDVTAGYGGESMGSDSIDYDVTAGYGAVSLARILTDGPLTKICDPRLSAARHRAG